jgi:hypothetical protein
MSKLGSMPPPAAPPSPAMLPRWSPPAAPEGAAPEDAARCCSPADCSHRAMNASLESPIAACDGSGGCAAAAEPAPPPARRCDLRCGANLAAWVARSRESRGGAGGGGSGGGGSQIYGARECGARRIGNGEFGNENLLGERRRRAGLTLPGWLLCFSISSLSRARGAGGREVD